MTTLLRWLGDLERKDRSIEWQKWWSNSTPVGLSSLRLFMERGSQKKMTKDSCPVTRSGSVRYKRTVLWETLEWRSHRRYWGSLNVVLKWTKPPVCTFQRRTVKEVVKVSVFDKTSDPGRKVSGSPWTLKGLSSWVCSDFDGVKNSRYRSWY